MWYSCLQWQHTLLHTLKVDDGALLLGLAWEVREFWNLQIWYHLDGNSSLSLKLAQHRRPGDTRGIFSSTVGLQGSVERTKII